MQLHVWDGVEKALNDLDFPAAKEEIIAHAGERTDDEDVIRMLRTLPLGTYRNLGEVRRSVRFGVTPPEGPVMRQKADQSRSPHSQRIAEHLRRTEDEPTERRGNV